MTEDKPLHVLLINERGTKIAHCLEYDLVASGKTTREALDALTLMVKAHIAHAASLGQPAHAAHRALPAWWLAWDRGWPIRTELFLRTDGIRELDEAGLKALYASIGKWEES